MAGNAYLKNVVIRPLKTQSLSIIVIAWFQPREGQRVRIETLTDHLLSMASRVRVREPEAEKNIVDHLKSNPGPQSRGLTPIPPPLPHVYSRMLMPRAAYSKLL